MLHLKATSTCPSARTGSAHLPRAGMVYKIVRNCLFSNKSPPAYLLKVEALQIPFQLTESEFPRTTPQDVWNRPSDLILGISGNGCDTVTTTQTVKSKLESERNLSSSHPLLPKFSFSVLEIYHLFIYVCLSVCLSVYLSVYHLSVYLSIGWPDGPF